ncbi:MAG: PHP domain-containing protein [Promethearchaeota archaeon]
MNFPKINFHIHSIYSDGRFSIRVIIRRALKLKLEYIAITDHFSNSWKCQVIPTLSSHRKIAHYLTTLNHHQKKLKEKGKSLHLYKGIEIDLGSSEEYIRNLINPEDYDLILFEYLETYEGLVLANKLINYWKVNISSNSFPLLGLAHFDPFHYMNDTLDKKEFFQFLKSHSIYFEFNSRYPEYYSLKYEDFFKRLKQENILITIGTDSHGLKRLNDYSEPIQMIQYYSLEKNFLSFFDLLKKL